MRNLDLLAVHIFLMRDEYQNQYQSSDDPIYKRKLEEKLEVLHELTELIKNELIK